jgi:exonuclease 1
VQELDFKIFKDDMFIKTCIMSGCDYLPSIKGIGIKKAHKMFLLQENDQISEILTKLRQEGKLQVDDDYEENFEKAYLTFKF